MHGKLEKMVCPASKAEKNLCAPFLRLSIVSAVFDLLSYFFHRYKTTDMYGVEFMRETIH
jgi:hypothetical protein